MKTTYKEYGCTASITDKQDGTARLIVRNQYGQKVKDIFPNKYNPQVLLVSLVTRKRTYTRVIQTDKLGNEFAQYGTGYDMDRSFFLSLFR